MPRQDRVSNGVSMNVVRCTDSAGYGNDFQLIPTVRMESRHFIEGSFSRKFSSIVREL